MNSSKERTPNFSKERTPHFSDTSSDDDGVLYDEDKGFTSMEYTNYDVKRDPTIQIKFER